MRDMRKPSLLKARRAIIYFFSLHFDPRDFRNKRTARSLDSKRHTEDSSITTKSGDLLISNSEPVAEQS